VIACDPLDAVLVPVDGSALSMKAVPVAIDLAERLGARIDLLSAVPSADDVRDRDEQLASAMVHRVDMHRTVVVDLDAAGAVHRRLEELGTAIVCMASHGRGRSAAVLGSVTFDVIVRGHHPVIVVGPAHADRHDGSGVVCGADGSSRAAALLPEAMCWADRLDEPLLVVTVAEPVPAPVRDTPVRRRHGPDGDVDAYLGALVERLRAEGRNAATLTVWDPISPADGLADYLKEHLAVLVAVATHPRSRLARLLLGSTAAAIAFRSPSPVLIVPRSEE
jgi:nucleotide-binding universal stress UspA family protein